MSENNSDNKKEEFSFLTEKIKDEPVSRKKMLIKIGQTAGLAVVFGFVACLTFVVAQPKLKNLLSINDKSTISIPKDEEENTENSTQDVEGNPENPEGLAKPSDIKKEIDLLDYEKLQKEIYGIGREASKSIVTVTGVKNDVDWFNNSYENEGQAFGVIIGNNKKEYLILTEKKIIDDVDNILVSFCNGALVDASLKKYDGNTGLAVLGVTMAAVSEDTKSVIKEAVLGNSFRVAQGDTVIAIGSPTGSNSAISSGSIISTQNIIMTEDANYTLFSSNIVGSSEGSGVLINLSGEIIGVILQGYSNHNDQNTVNAISVSEIKSIIEDLSNGIDIPYVGLKTKTVSNDIAEKFNLPVGAFITSVAIDSPAMNAGIQNGDVIVKVNDTEIITAAGYSKELKKYRTGDFINITVMRQGTREYKEIVCNVKVGVLL